MWTVTLKMNMRLINFEMAHDERVILVPVEFFKGSLGWLMLGNRVKGIFMTLIQITILTWYKMKFHLPGVAIYF